ncbi:MAG: BatA and WFA domain-containing protein [bacterium]
MLHFFQPVFLAGLLLTGIPVVLHLFTRQRYAQVPFSSLMFLRTARRRSMRSVTLHHLLALLCRVSGVALITLSFAMPLARGKPWGAGASRASTAVFIIMDNSMSMRWRSRGATTYDRAKEFAGGIIGDAAGGEEIFITFLCGKNAGRVYSTAGSGNAAAMKVLRGSGPDYCDNDLSTALKDAVRKLSASTATERKIVIAGDVQKNAFRFKPLPRPGFPVTAMIVDASGGTPRENLTVAPAPSPGSLILGVPAPLCFEVRGSGGARATLSLIVDGVNRGERTAGPRSGGSGRVCFSVTLAKPGVHHGEARLAPDALEADNRWYFRLEAREALRTLVAAGRDAAENPASDAYYIVRAFRAANAAGPGFQWVRASLRSAAELPYVPLREYDAAVLPSDAGVDLKGLKRLRDFVTRGGGALVFTRGGDPSAKSIAETLFPAGAGIRTRPAAQGEGAPGAGDRFIRVETLARDHPIFSHLGEGLAELMTARFSGAGSVSAAGPGARILATLQGGEPLIVESRLGRGTVLLVSRGMNPRQTSLALQPVFVPWLIGACRHVGGTGTRHGGAFQYGADFSVAFDKRIGEEIELRAPGGGVRVPLAAVDGERKKFTLSDERAAVAPGIYEIAASATGRRLDAAAVNHAPEEGSLERASESALRKKMPGFNVVLVPWRWGKDEAVDVVFAREYTPLLPLLIFAATLALLLDTRLSNRR